MRMRIIMISMRISSIDTDIVICEFTHLRVVDSEDFGFLRGAKTETGDEVHDPEDDGLCDDGMRDQNHGKVMKKREERTVRTKE